MTYSVEQNNAFDYRELVRHAQSFVDMGFEVLLANQRAALEKEKIFMTIPIFEMLKKAGHKQISAVYLPEGSELSGV